MKKNQKNNKKKKLTAMALLALLAAGAGTFAWINSADFRVNRVTAEGGGLDQSKNVALHEDFMPQPISPGSYSKKEVLVRNAGSMPVFVRVSYEEVLKTLVSGGDIVYQDNPWTPLTTSPTDPTKLPTTEEKLAHDVPVEVADLKKEYEDKGYTKIAASKVTNGDDVSAAKLSVDDYVVYVKGFLKYDNAGGIVREFDGKIVRKYKVDNVDKYQQMTATFSYDEASTTIVASGTNAANFEGITVKEMKYGVYENGYKYTAINWAESVLQDQAAVTAGLKTTALGTAGKDSNNKEFNYTAFVLGKDVLPATTTAATTAQIPTSSNRLASVHADMKAFGTVDATTNAFVPGKSGIKVQYSNDLINATSLSTNATNKDDLNNKWVFNSEDGYFYYTSPLKSGDSTGKLLEKIVYTDDVGANYTNAEYDLVVKMEALAAIKDALTGTGSGGWQLNGSTNTKPLTLKIQEYLADQAVQ